MPMRFSSFSTILQKRWRAVQSYVHRDFHEAHTIDLNENTRLKNEIAKQPKLNWRKSAHITHMPLAATLTIPCGGYSLCNIFYAARVVDFFFSSLILLRVRFVVGFFYIYKFDSGDFVSFAPIHSAFKGMYMSVVVDIKCMIRLASLRFLLSLMVFTFIWTLQFNFLLRFVLAEGIDLFFNCAMQFYFLEFLLSFQAFLRIFIWHFEKSWMGWRSFKNKAKEKTHHKFINSIVFHVTMSTMWSMRRWSSQVK